ncbi:preATP grasp domain-containing protein [Streptomyces sp. NPDC001220]
MGIKLLLLNIRVDLPKDLSLGDSFPIAKSTARSLWHMTEDCIIVCPYQVEVDYINQVTGTLGIDPESIRIIFAESLLWDDVLMSERIWTDIEAARKELGGEIVNVESCFHTRGVIELKRKIFGGDLSASDAFLAEGGNELFNRKVVFRKLAAGQGIPLPEGRVVQGAAALHEAVLELMPITGTVIIKRDNAYAGLGNVAISSEAPRPLQGVNKGYTEKNPTREFIESIYSDMLMLGSEVLIVEAYYDFTSAFFFEYFIEEDGKARLLQSYDMKHRPAGGPDEWWRMDWMGLQMPANLPLDKQEIVRKHSEKMFRLAADMGYRGYIHLDGIQLHDGRILFNETNARWSGGTVLHKIGSRLLGANYENSHLASYRLLPTASASVLYPCFTESELQFSHETESGNVLVVCDPEVSSETEALVIGQSRKTVLSGERRLVDYILEANASATN